MAESTNYLLKCIECGADFFTAGERDFYISKGLNMPKRCKSCRDKKKARLKQDKEKVELQEILSTSPYIHVEKTEIPLTDSATSLFIIGNGFDIMHGVKSSYYNFRDTIGRQNILRFTLENYIRQKDVWGNFEDGLAYLDREMMLGTLDDWLEDFEVPDEDDDDFSAADYFAAQDTATSQIYILTQELPKRFRKWISTLKTLSLSKPVDDIIKMDARYINFNYTEFLETIYGVPHEKILYIHGDRRDKKNQLVLGHGHDIEEVFEEWYQTNKNRKEFQPKILEKDRRYDHNDNPVYLGYFLKDETKGNWKSQMRYDAINNTVGLIEDYYENSSKKTSEVISRNQSYFKSLEGIENIVVIGHSLSKVDYPYFREIIKYNKSSSDLKWFISWYSMDGLKKIIEFVSEMKIPNENVKLFRV
ncbi:putative zinc ribbon protein [Natranaerovirga hydrolytica]|uniref:Putative zinc ribbon protein n=1 Tax=Natranaerovirga hydrolytica TaxID=680378 RepID=A0A4R1MK89_9FIRM|nr:AbiH family protein [Natranaerovirga hydrolytica]TCK93146.1 putative zinc ribbon protein [Natranaerovirga hydrolytica]